jgi:hypothetical protein
MSEGKKPFRARPLRDVLLSIDSDKKTSGGQSTDCDITRITAPEHRRRTPVDLFVVEHLPPATALIEAAPSETVASEAVHSGEAEQAVGTNTDVDYSDDHPADYYLSQSDGGWSAYGSGAQEVVSLPSDAPRASLIQRIVEFFDITRWFKRNS